MSRENVQTIRAFYERWDRYDVVGFSELLTEDAEFASPAGAIDTGGRRGAAGFVAVRQAVANRFGPFSHEIQELREAEATVVASVLFRALGAEGASAVEQPEYHVWTLRDHKIARFAWFHGFAEALESGGLI